MTCDQYEEDVKNEIEPFLYEWVSERRGSISAEHGNKTELFFIMNEET